MTSKRKTRPNFTRKPKTEKAPDGVQLSGCWADVKAELQEKKERELADRVQLQTEIMRGDFVLRSITASVLGGIFSVYRSQFLIIGESIGDTISALIGVKEAHKIRRLMSDQCYTDVGEITKKAEAFITKA